MELAFWKMHGIGNDYVLVNCLEQTIENPEKAAVLLSDRHTGIGSDGLILVESSETADFRMRMYNADGSRGRMCGNGIRCLGKYVYDNGLTRKKQLRIETDSGVRELKLEEQNGAVTRVTVDMGIPSMEAAEIPIQTKDPRWIHKAICLGSRLIHVTCVSVGNPHTVIFVTDVQKADVHGIGRKLEHAHWFPEGTNVEFVEVKGKNRLRVRVWERGSGETQACGTGACASVAAAAEQGICEQGLPVFVELEGGKLTVWYERNGRIRMRGPAAFVFSGQCQI